MKVLQKNHVNISSFQTDFHLYKLDYPFVNKKHCGFILEWSGNIGFGEYIIYLDAKNDEEWYGDSECMDKSDDKWFLELLMKDFINKTIID